jgi:hypothetical protein
MQIVAQVWLTPVQEVTLGDKVQIGYGWQKKEKSTFGW